MANLIHMTEKGSSIEKSVMDISKNIGLLYRKINRYFYNFKYEIDEINFNDSKRCCQKNRLQKR